MTFIFPLDREACELIVAEGRSDLWADFWNGACSHLESGGAQADVDMSEDWLLCEARLPLYSAYMQRFVNRTDIWGQQFALKDGSVGYYQHKPECPSLDSNFCRRGLEECAELSLGDIHNMVEGGLTISLSATGGANSSKWCVWDFDAANGARERVETFLRKTMGLMPYAEATPSPNKDGHLWLFFDTPMPAETLLLFAMGVERAMEGFSYADNAVEFFPKYSNGGYSQIRAPLGKHRKANTNGGYGYFTDAHPGMEAQLAFITTIQTSEVGRIEGAANYMRSVLEAEALLAQQSLTPKTTYSNTDYSSQQQVNALEFVDARRSGKQYIGQCPLCALEGHDAHRNNLHISEDGLTFNCVYGGPNTTHKTIELVKHFQQFQPTH